MNFMWCMRWEGFHSVDREGRKAFLASCTKNVYFALNMFLCPDDVWIVGNGIRKFVGVRRMSVGSERAEMAKQHWQHKSTKAELVYEKPRAGT